MLSVRTVLLLFSTSLMAVFVSGCTLLQRPANDTGSVKVYAYPVSNFTRIPISINGIQDAADTIITDTKGFKYIVQLDSLLRHTAPEYDSLFDSWNVRTAISAPSFETIYLDRQSDIYYKKHTYRNTKATYSIIKKLFPQSIRDRYLSEPD